MVDGRWSVYPGVETVSKTLPELMETLSMQSRCPLPRPRPAATAVLGHPHCPWRLMAVDGVVVAVGVDMVAEDSTIEVDLGAADEDLVARGETALYSSTQQLERVTPSVADRACPLPAFT